MPYTARSHQLKQSLIYHIFNRGINRGKIFLDEEDYFYFIKLLREYSQKASLNIYHWVIMPNHYHIVTEIKEPEKISSVMAGLGRSYACYHHRRHKTAGYLWQGRFKSQPIQKELYLTACGRYVERNPVKAGIVEAAEEYPYSSARFYALGFQDNLTEASPLFSDFGENLKEKQQAYREFLRLFNSEEESLFEKIEFPRGSPEFIKRLIKERGRFFPMRRGRARV